MNGNCHLIFGTAVGISASLIMADNPETATLLITTGIIGSLFPDIDNKNSHIGQLTRPISTLINKISGIFGKTGKNHRGIFHDPTVYIAGLILSIFFFPYLIGFFIGALSHLLLDATNPSGVPCLMFKRIHMGNVPSDSKMAVVITWVFTAILLVTSFIMYEEDMFIGLFTPNDIF